jgi:hypothetical protein
MRILPLALLSAFWVLPASALELDLPVACVMGRDCLIQKYVDQSVGPEVKDRSCNRLTDDEHNGTDFRVRTVTDMRKGVAVLAAADGVVMRVREGEPDISVRIGGPVKGKEAGNAVLIRHDQDHTAIYAHLRQGSVRVKPGDRVVRGQPLGLIGMSGNAEYPHMHLTLWRGETVIDPFTGAERTGSCDPAAATAPIAGLWSASARAALAYLPTTVIAGGFADRQVTAEDIRSGSYSPPVFRPDSILLFWIDAMGVRKGDQQRFELRGPGGEMISSHVMTHDRGGLAWFAFHGKRAPKEGWRKGRYSASYSLTRDGLSVGQYSASVEMRP